MTMLTPPGLYFLRYRFEHMGRASVVNSLRGSRSTDLPSFGTHRTETEERHGTVSVVEDDTAPNFRLVLVCERDTSIDVDLASERQIERSPGGAVGRIWLDADRSLRIRLNGRRLVMFVAA